MPSVRDFYNCGIVFAHTHMNLLGHFLNLKTLQDNLNMSPGYSPRRWNNDLTALHEVHLLYKISVTSMNLFL